MKELDRDAIEANRELSVAETNFISTYKKRQKLSTSELLNIDAMRLLSKQKQGEKVAVGENLLATIEKYLRKLDADLVVFEAQVRSVGTYESLGADPGTDVAIRPDEYEENAWILGRVLQFYRETGYYDIVDLDDSSKRYNLSESQVIVLPCDREDLKKLARGDEVLAVYPDTTSFYPATVAQPIKRITGSNEMIGVQVMIGVTWNPA